MCLTLKHPADNAIRFACVISNVVIYFNFTSSDITTISILILMSILAFMIEQCGENYTRTQVRYFNNGMLIR